MKKLILALLGLLVFLVTATAALGQERALLSGHIPNCDRRIAPGTVCRWNPIDQEFPTPQCSPEMLAGTVCSWPLPVNSVGETATVLTLEETGPDGMDIRPVAVIFGKFRDPRMFEYGYALGAYTNCIGESVVVKSTLSSWDVRVPLLAYGGAKTFWNGCQQ